MSTSRTGRSRLDPAFDGPGEAGVDEAGRGPLAGPLTVAVVLLDPAHPIVGLDDSKRLSATRREGLAAMIRARALAWHVEWVEAEEIDASDILRATLAGMRRAILALDPAPTRVWVDGMQVPTGLDRPAQALIGGDGRVAAIAAASILAKVARDARMCELEIEYPGYGFARHKGYPSPAHLEALRRLGPCLEHRQSFRPVREWRVAGRD